MSQRALALNNLCSSGVGERRRSVNLFGNSGRSAFPPPLANRNHHPACFARRKKSYYTEKAVFSAGLVWELPVRLHSGARVWFGAMGSSCRAVSSNPARLHAASTTRTDGRKCFHQE